MYFRADTNQLVVEGNDGQIILGYLGIDENNREIYGLSIGDLSTVPELVELNDAVINNSQTLSNYTKKITITSDGIIISSEENGEGTKAELTSEALVLRAGYGDRVTESTINADGFTINNGIINEQLRFNNQ